MLSTCLRRPLAAAFMAALLTLGAIAQDLPETRMFVADRGNVSGGSDGAVFEFTLTGDFISQLPNFGSGAIRGIAVADNGDVYVARGGAVNRFDAAGGYAAGTTFALGSMAQDIAIHPVTGNVWCSFGTSASTAMVVEMTPAGVTVNTVTDALMLHPRSIEFDLIGNNLYVANVAGFNVLHIDSTPAMTPVVSVFAAETDLGMGFTPIHVYPSRIQDQFVTVVGDYGSVTEILTVTGIPGSVGVTTLLDYGTTGDLLAPAGGSPDSHGNLYMTGRDRNMATPGIYVLREDTGNRPIPVITSTMLINPMGAAFRRTRLDVTITSQAGNNVNGFPRVVAGGNQLQLVGIDISAPEFPNAGYLIFFSAFTSPLLAPLACQLRPLGAGIDLAANGDPRFLPLDNTDPNTIGDSLNIVLIGGNGSFDDPCPGAQDGSAMRFVGGLNAFGEANAELMFPAFPCVPAGSGSPDLIYGFTVLILDGLTTPLGVGPMSTFPSCLVLEFP